MSEDAMSEDAIIIGKQVAKKEFIRRAAILLLTAILLGNLFINSFTLVKINGTVDAVRSTQGDTSPTGKRLLAISQSIEDCVKVDGDCYKNRLQNANNSTNTILSAMAATIACAVENPTYEFKSLRVCVFKTLDRSME